MERELEASAMRLLGTAAVAVGFLVVLFAFVTGFYSILDAIEEAVGRDKALVLVGSATALLTWYLVHYITRPFDRL